MTEIKERPILVSPELVRAYLDGRKWQTRRIVKPQPEQSEKLESGAQLYQWVPNGSKGWFAGVTREQLVSDAGLLYPGRCPYGNPGDRLWVRENGWEPPERITNKMLREGADTWPKWVYDADEPDFDCLQENNWIRRPSIHMPRVACRLVLDVVNIRAERLQDITEEDAVAEGMVFHYPTGNPDVVRFAAGRQPTLDDPSTAIGAFREKWFELHGKESWHSNPWVWVIETKAGSPPHDCG